MTPAQRKIKLLAQQCADKKMTFSEARRVFDYFYFADIIMHARGRAGVAAEIAKTNRVRHSQLRRADKLLDGDIDTDDESCSNAEVNES